MFKSTLVILIYVGIDILISIIIILVKDSNRDFFFFCNPIIMLRMAEIEKEQKLLVEPHIENLKEFFPPSCAVERAQQNVR